MIFKVYNLRYIYYKKIPFSTFSEMLSYELSIDFS